MTRFFAGHSVNDVLPDVLEHLLSEQAPEVGSRNGRVKEALNAQIELWNPVRREVLTQNRRANIFAQIAETMWVLSGRNDIAWLEPYLPRARQFSDDGKTWQGGYGPRIRSHFGVDQLDHVVNLLKEDPLTRRAVISIYDPSVDTLPGLDIPCNDFLQFQSRGGRLHLTVTVRSNDVIWGWSGINAFEWSTLQEIVASMLNIDVGPLLFNIGSLHLYEHHWKRASEMKGGAQVVHTPRDTVPFDPDGLIDSVSELDRALEQWFIWEAMCREGDPALSLDLAEEQEPLFRSWAIAIAYFWTRESRWLRALSTTVLEQAVYHAPASAFPEPVRTASEGSGGAAPVAGHPRALREPSAAFYEYVADLHREKHRSYGDSWKKRGEKMSILANIARKVDRLGVGDSFDTSADTLIDLWVYLIKYHGWLSGAEDTPESVNTMAALALEKTARETPEDGWQEKIPDVFNRYADMVDTVDLFDKRGIVWELILSVTPVARDQWYVENEYRPSTGV